MTFVDNEIPFHVEQNDHVVLSTVEQIETSLKSEKAGFENNGQDIVENISSLFGGMMDYSWGAYRCV